MNRGKGDAVQHEHSDIVELPRPTAWPLVLALGFSLIMAGMVTNIGVGILGLLLNIAGSVGWCFQVFPHEQHEAVSVTAAAVKVTSTRTLMERPPRLYESAAPRKILPIETFRITTGIRGGIAGGIAMIVPGFLTASVSW